MPTAKKKTAAKSVGRPKTPSWEKRVRLCGGPLVSPDVHHILKNYAKAKELSIGQAVDELTRIGVSVLKGDYR